MSAESEDQAELTRPKANTPWRSDTTNTKGTTETQDGGDESGEDSEEDADEDEDEDEEEEDDEPKLKYARLTSHLGAVYRNGDATSTFLVAGDKMVGPQVSQEYVGKDCS